MEQTILDPSKYKMSIHSLDTRFAESLYNENSEFKIACPYPLKNIVRVRLASVEVPLVEYGISAAKGNDTFRIKFGQPSTYPNKPWLNSGHIRAGNYSAAQLCAAVQNALLNISSGFIVKIDTLSGIITIENPNNPFSIDFSSTNPIIQNRSSHWGLGYILGFRQKIVQTSLVDDLVSTNFTLTATSIPDLQPTPYFLLQLKCPESVVNVYHRVSNKSYIECFAKLVLKNNVYEIQFDDNSNLLRKEYTFLAPVTIPFFHFKLLDPWGDSPSLLYSDWSVALEVTEVVNSKTYGELSKTYARN